MTQFRKPNQTRFIELVTAIQKADPTLNDAQIARAIRVSRASMSRWRSCKSDLEDSKIASLENLLGKLTNPVQYALRTETVAGMDASEVEEATMMLKEIHEDNKASFDTIKNVITTYYSKKRPKPVISSSEASKAVDHAERARVSGGKKAPDHKHP